jgi:hypothetical protein
MATHLESNPTASATVAVTVLVAVSITETLLGTKKLLKLLFGMYANGAAWAAGAANKSAPRTAHVKRNVALDFVNRVAMLDMMPSLGCYFVE